MVSFGGKRRTWKHKYLLQAKNDSIDLSNYFVITADLSYCELFVCIWPQYLGIILTESKQHIFIICLAAEAIYLLDAMESLTG